MLMRLYHKISLFTILLTGFCFLYGNVCHAEEKGLEKLRKESVRIKTLQADFTQKKSMKILSRPLVSQGYFYFAMPDSLRWEYIKPLKSVVLSHNQQARRYMHSDGKWVEDKTNGVQAMRIVLNEIAGWMNGRFDQNPSFKATVIGKENTCIILTPVGKKMKGMIERIEINLAPQARVVQSVKILEGPDNITQINFSNVKMNHAIDPTIFKDVR